MPAVNEDGQPMTFKDKLTYLGKQPVKLVKSTWGKIKSAYNWTSEKTVAGFNKVKHVKVSE